jgi:hypothetical protein
MKMIKRVVAKALRSALGSVEGKMRHEPNYKNGSRHWVDSDFEDSRPSRPMPQGGYYSTKKKSWLRESFD